MNFKKPKTKGNFKGDISLVPTAADFMSQRYNLSLGHDDQESITKSVNNSMSSPVNSSPWMQMSSPAESSPSLSPSMKCGWLKKDGHGILRSVTIRYFVLYEGVLTYYEKSSDVYPYGINEKGVAPLQGAHVEARTKNNKYQIYLTGTFGKNKDLLIEVDNVNDQSSWISALQQHINYYSTKK